MMRWTPLAEGLAASRAALDARQAAAASSWPLTASRSGAIAAVAQLRQRRWVGEHMAMGRVPSTRQLALLAVSLTAWDDEADDPVGYEEALAAMADPAVRTASVRGWDAARSAVAESAYLLRGLGAD
jgi:hypothetical protein